MKKRVWGVLLCMMMLCSLLAVAATAAGTDLAAVDGVGMGDGSEAMYFVNGSAAAVNVEPAVWNAKFESVGGVLTLTLDGLDIQNDVEIDDDALIVLESDSTVAGYVRAGEVLTIKSGGSRNKLSCTEIVHRGSTNLDLSFENVEFVGGIRNGNVGHSDLVKAVGSTITTSSLSWMTDGGIVLEGSTLTVDSYFWTERLQMDDASVVYMNAPLWNYAHVSESEMLADLGRYLSAGYRIGTDNSHTTIVYDGGANDGLEAAPVVLRYASAPPSRPTIKHRCESKCSICGGCEDLKCLSARCMDKCTLLVPPFTDVPADAWYASAVAYVTHLGIMEGTSETAFSPMGETSRAMLVTILRRMENEPVVNYLLPFADVPAETWYTEAVRWAASEKIVFGYDTGLFGGEDTVTREQAVAIFHRYAQWKGVDVSVGENTNILSYPDVFAVGDWAIGAMQWTCGSGFLRGAVSGELVTLEPARLITRAETAALLQQYLVNVAK